MRSGWVVIVAIVAVALSVGSCAALTISPEDRAELERLTAKETVLMETIEETIAFVDAKKARVMEVVAKGKSGELTGIEVASLLGELYPAIAEGEDKMARLVGEYDSVKTSIKNLSESGVSWVHIILHSILAVWGVASTRGYFTKRGEANAASSELSGVKKYADLALNGVRILTGAMESVYMKSPVGSESEKAIKEVKSSVATKRNKIIESEVAVYPSKAKSSTA